MKRIVLVAMLVLVGSAATASAVPVRDVDFYNAGDTGYASATIYSPPTATSCGAYYAIQISRIATRAAYITRSGRVNVCRDQDDTGWSRGAIRVSFNFLRWPIDTYIVCVAASQRLVSGAVSRHAACVRRRV